MANKKKDVLIKSFIERREFSYKEGNATLVFTLRVDNSSELRSFHSCLEEAKSDIETILKGMKN